MVDVLWWLQAAGAILSLLLTGGGLVAAAYATVRDTPQFWRRLTGQTRIEQRLKHLHADHKIAQELALQQAKEFNHFVELAAEDHGWEPEERPYINPSTIREELMRDDPRPDFTRGGDGRPSDD